MAVHTLGTSATTSLAAITMAPPNVLAPADIAAIAASIADDVLFAATNPTGILGTGSTHSNATLDTLVRVAGGPLASIQLGSLVLGAGIPPGTFVIAKPTATSVTLSQAATATAGGVKIGIVPLRNVPRLSPAGLLEIPNRGILKVLPSDVVAIDSTGWPVLVSAASIAYSGSLWSYT